ncbi:MAG: FHA domain-containing protein [Bacteroidales bacterium]|nr:FHA domain-containing protein [Bacteroidales bacterium]MCM1146746.1 FHA domain-containing protein [Bacteroidales bacterium]MCM1205563.1 FHA domain-containing protein [Bacillota bacterium]MCM1509175.1 FHA domain-containing protein [Clostridium sp.]
MKRVRCPKCDNYIIFDETKYEDGQQLVFQCQECGKQFAIRMGVSKLQRTRRETNPEEEAEQTEYGSIHVIENVFGYKQVLPLHLGDNIIGKYAKGNEIHCPVETSDPSMDLQHCILNISRNKRGALKYILRDGPSNTGTFVDNDILGDRERRVIEHGTLFTCGATSIILHINDNEE